MVPWPTGLVAFFLSYNLLLFLFKIRPLNLEYTYIFACRIKWCPLLTLTNFPIFQATSLDLKHSHILLTKIDVFAGLGLLTYVLIFQAASTYCTVLYEHNLNRDLAMFFGPVGLLFIFTDVKICLVILTQHMPLFRRCKVVVDSKPVPKLFKHYPLYDGCIWYKQ